MEIVGAKGPDHKEMMAQLGRLCDASFIEYRDVSGSEQYIIVKNSQVWKIQTAAGYRQGGYLKSVKRTE